MLDKLGLTVTFEEMVLDIFGLVVILGLMALALRVIGFKLLLGLIEELRLGVTDIVIVTELELTWGVELENGSTAVELPEKFDRGSC